MPTWRRLQFGRIGQPLAPVASQSDWLIGSVRGALTAGDAISPQESLSERQMASTEDLGSPGGGLSAKQSAVSLIETKIAVSYLSIATSLSSDCPRRWPELRARVGL